MDYNAAVAAIRMPERIRRLRVDDRGYPVPWFVAWIDGQPDFRVVDTPKIAVAWKQRRCWVCGDVLGRNVAFALGPMCCVNRTVSEPPSHLECVEFAMRACPFLANPRMRRNEKELPEHMPSPGVGLKRNPGVMAIWVTRGYRPFRVDNGYLWTFDGPVRVDWWTEGRSASWQEVHGAIERGLPALQEIAAEEGPNAEDALRRQVASALRYLPASEAA